MNFMFPFCFFDLKGFVKYAQKKSVNFYIAKKMTINDI